MALAPESVAPGASGAHDPFIDLLEVSLAAMAPVAPFSRAAVLLMGEGALQVYVAAPAGDDFSGLVGGARERLVALEPDAAALQVGAPVFIQAPLAGMQLAAGAASVQHASIQVGDAVRGVIRLERAIDPPVVGAAALFAVAQALSRSLGRGTRPAVASSSSDGNVLLELADATGEGYVQVDAEGMARALNDAGRRLLASIGGAEGVLAPAAALDALAAANATEAPVLRELAAQGPESRHIAMAALVRDGQSLVALRDHTEGKLLQERLLQSEKMASVGQLVSGVAHELNNPLTGVMGFAQLLLARDLEDTVRSQVQTIYGEAERAAKIVQNLLSFARRRKPAKEMADVNALLQRVLELRSYDFTIRNISLDLTLDSRMPRVWVDPDQIQQVFFNLIKNAEQAMIEANGGGKLRVTTLQTASGIRIAIADDGPGIPAEFQRRIFDPFFTTKAAGQGTGLGLTISYGIIDEHGGRIWAENGSSGGSVFLIDLPLGSPAEGLAGPDDRAPGRPSSSSPRSRRVLVVDDEESIRLLLHDILEMDGHSVQVAASGLQGLQRLQAEDFDVIITDMKMPEMDGATFYREVASRLSELARRIIFITGDTVSPDTRAFLQQVQNPVLSKPFKIGPLREAMETVLAE
jgi:signal transduction histidine kinase